MGNFEPYFVERNQSGIFADLIREIFSEIPNAEPAFVFGHSNNSLLANYNAGRLDAVANLFDSADIDTCRSDPVFRFRDVAITLAEDAISISTVSALKGKSIVTFEGARNFFGSEFSQLIDDKHYQEVGKPELQAKILFSLRYQVSVGDLFIFLNAKKKLEQRAHSLSEVVVHDIFPKIESRMGFKDAALCQTFNAALKKVRESGRYEAIYSDHLQALTAK
nr:ABC transporter substrate-binding protein [Simiduia aestuariiviva]